MVNLPRQVGLTLVELMVSMCVLLVIVSMGIPSFQNHLKDNRRITKINELVSSMNLARSEATKGNGAVAICPSQNGTTCAGTTYDSGWLVFINSDGDIPPAVDSGEEILRALEGTTGTGTSLRATAGIRSGFNFLASGQPSSFGDITYCDDRGAWKARGVVLNMVGMIRASGTHADESDLSCP